MCVMVRLHLEISPRAGSRTFFSFNDVLTRLPGTVQAQKPESNALKLYTGQSYYRGFVPFTLADLSLLYVTIALQAKTAEFYLWLHNDTVHNVSSERMKMAGFVYTTSVLLGTLIYTPLRAIHTRLIATIDLEKKEVKNKSGRKVLYTNIYQPSIREICMRPGLFRGYSLVAIHVGIMNLMTLRRIFN